MSMRAVTLLTVVGLFSLAPYAVAQKAAVTTAPDDNAACTPGARSPLKYSDAIVSDAPFSATRKVTFDQTISGGKVIHSVTRTLAARSSDGKVRIETWVGCEVDDHGRAFNKLDVRIADPIAATFLEWYTGGVVLKVARLLNQAPMGGYAGISLSPLGESSSTLPGRSVTTTRVESLGTKMIAGIAAQGQRFTMTTVAMQGGAGPTIAVHDKWISIEHGLILEDLLDSPERGRSEMVLENLSLKEPDRALFVPPEGYAIVDNNPKPKTQQ
jgi:hypothetical protein